MCPILVNGISQECLEAASSKFGTNVNQSADDGCTDNTTLSCYIKLWLVVWLLQPVRCLVCMTVLRGKTEGRKTFLRKFSNRRTSLGRVDSESVFLVTCSRSAFYSPLLSEMCLPCSPFSLNSPQIKEEELRFYFISLWCHTCKQGTSSFGC